MQHMLYNNRNLEINRGLQERQIMVRRTVFSSEDVVKAGLAVMDQGEIIQHGSPKQVYEQPRNRFVTEFLGAANLIEGSCRDKGIETEMGFFTVQRRPAWKNGTVAIRPERIRIRPELPQANGLKATVREAIYRGNNVDLWLEPGPLRIRSEAHRNYEPGQEVFLELPAEGLVVLDE